MEPRAKTPPPSVLSPDVTATQALELLASVSARTHVSEFRHRFFGGTSINITIKSTKPQSVNSVMQFFYYSEMPDFTKSNT